MTDPVVVRAQEKPGVAARRRFLACCGTFAAVTPPAITLLLTTAGGSYALAQSGTRGDPPPDTGGNDVGDGDSAPANTEKAETFHLKYEPTGGRGSGR